jgi:hypothetical protein
MEQECDPEFQDIWYLCYNHEYEQNTYLWNRYLECKYNVFGFELLFLYFGIIEFFYGFADFL